MKYCCLRFDADTHVCVSRGIPRLAAVADSLGVPFTFFVNMGRSFDPWITLAKSLARRRGSKRDGAALPVASKLGLMASLQAAVLNPNAGGYDPAALQTAARGGHELGLHGGRNHAHWERSALKWSEDRLRAEVRYGLQAMEACGLPVPRAFASPAWKSPRLLPRVLAAHGFRVLADALGPMQANVPDQGLLLDVPTNITAQPAGIGFLEAAQARGWSGERIRREFQRQLRTQAKLAVVYDHPFFAGIHALEWVRDLVQVAQDEGFTVVTISAAAQALQAEMSLPAGGH